ncbi:DUF192 domain-containing protein [Candidatus Woesearchaeota archaeon]|nr:DUF192 domain-containing protein [Candidatus Woesearchaeota archaeon]
MQKELTNTTRATTISKDYQTMKGILQKAQGLMFKSKVRKPLIFEFSRETRISLHMIMVFCTIDVMLLDRNNKVVELKPCLRPFQLYTSKNKAKYAIELEEGAIKKSKTELGDRLSF